MSDWLVSEPMVSFYLKTFLDSMWPDGQLAKPAAKRTDDVIIISFISIINNNKNFATGKTTDEA